MEVDFCPACRQVVSRDYLYCPHCGERIHRVPPLGTILDGPFARLERHRETLAFDRLKESVEQLERDLDQFLENRALPKS